MELSFTTLDVFTSTRFEGNPLAVVGVPAALRGAVTTTLKQAVAREFNFSETVFLHEPAGGGHGDGGGTTATATAKVLEMDIFTVDRELPFAGHPTIGTAVLARHHLYPAVDTLLTKSGPIRLLPPSVPGSRAVRVRIAHNVRYHYRTLGDVLSAAVLASYAGLSHHDAAMRDAELEAPVFSIVPGMSFLLVRLASLEQLARVRRSRLDFPAALTDADWPQGFLCRYYYVPEEEERGGGGDGGARRLRARMVEADLEDPATGSAASALAAYLTLTETHEGARFVVTQGVEMGRRSIIHVETAAAKNAEGNVEIQDVWLGGEAVVVQKGTLILD